MIKTNSSNEITRLRFSDTRFDGTVHGFFSRGGGVSPAPWNSLNLGNGLGDTTENIVENRKRIFSELNRPVESLFDVWQIHSTNVVFATEPRNGKQHQQGDAIFTDKPELTLLMRFADCVPILVYHPRKRVIGIIHAGWKGTVDQIVVLAVRQACDHFSMNPNDLIAGIGPSIGPDHYMIGEDVFQAAEKVFSRKDDEIFSSVEGKKYFNLWKANRNLLQNSGVGEILSMDICTACHTDQWFSHRMEKGITGRFAGVIAIDN